MARTALTTNRNVAGTPTIEDSSLTTGARFFVHSSGADSDSVSTQGTNPDEPYATIDYAVGKCTANKNDMIYVMPGHAETISAAAGIDADKAGITICGLGNGDNRPVVTFGTSTAADMDIDAANITVKNIVFKNDIDAQVAMIDVNSTDCTFEDCEFREGSSKQWATCIDINGGSANACDRAKIKNCKFTSTAAGADNAIKLGEVADGVVIEGCDIDGDFNDAGIHNPTGKVLTNLTLKNNTVRNRQAGDHAIELVSACTGKATRNDLFADTPGVVFDPGSLLCSGNFESHKIDSAGVPSPAGLTDAVFGIHITRATADVFTGSAVPVFSVAGGRVLLTLLVAEVTTVIGSGANNFKFQFNPTTGTTVDLCANLDIDADEAGTLYTLDGTPATALIRSESGAARNMQNHGIVLGIGDIEALSAGNVTGSLKIDLWYRALDSGARIAAA